MTEGVGPRPLYIQSTRPYWVRNPRAQMAEAGFGRMSCPGLLTSVFGKKTSWEENTR